MPKRTNDFQTLITLIEKHLAPHDASVTESKLFIDQRTGQEREVDIVIDATAGIHPFVIGIECIDHKRPATVSWIETISAKHQDLPLHKTILVSRAGFSKTALKKAQALKIETLTLREASESDWVAIFHKSKSIGVKNFLLPYLNGVTVVFDSAFVPAGIDPKQLAQAELYSSAGTSFGNLSEIAQKLIQSPEVIKASDEAAFSDTEISDASYTVKLEFPMREGSYILDSNRNKNLVRAVQIEAKCRKQVSTVYLEQGSYGGEAQVAIGTGKAFGRKINFALVQKNSDEQAQVSVSIHKTETPN